MLIGKCVCRFIFPFYSSLIELTHILKTCDAETHQTWQIFLKLVADKLQSTGSPMVCSGVI